MRKFAAKEKVSRISSDDIELDIAMRDILERFSEADSEHEKASDKKKKIAKDRSGKAEQMRKRSQETFAETLQWNENSVPKKKKPKSGSHAVE